MTRSCERTTPAITPPPPLHEVLGADDERLGRVEFSGALGAEPAATHGRRQAPASAPDAAPRPSPPRARPGPRPEPAPPRLRAVGPAERPAPSPPPVVAVGGVGVPEDELRHLGQSVDEVAASVVARMREAGEANRRHLEALEAEAARRYELLTAQAELDAELIRLHARREAYAIITAARMRSGELTEPSAESRRLDEVGESLAGFAEAFERQVDEHGDHDATATTATTTTRTPVPGCDDPRLARAPPPARRAGLAAVACLLVACTAPGGDHEQVGAPLADAALADGASGSVATRQPHRALPAPASGTVDVVGGTAALVRGVPRSLEGPAGPARVRVHTATDDLAYDRLCAGRADVVETVRPMAAGERAACDEAGLEVVTLPVASEATTVVVAGGSGLEGCLSQRQLAGLLADPPTITSWAQLGPGEAPVQARGADTSVADRLDWLLGTAEQRQALADLPRRTRLRAAFRARLSELRAAEDAAPTARARARVLARRARLRRQYDGVAARHDAAVAARVAAESRRGRVVVLPYADYTRRRDAPHGAGDRQDVRPCGLRRPRRRVDRRG